MLNKKQLTEDQLERVSGGIIYKNPNDIKWQFNIGDQVSVKLEDGVTFVEAIITKRGYSYYQLFNDYGDAYYISGVDNSYVNGWYMGGSNWITPNTTYVKGKTYMPVTTVDE